MKSDELRRLLDKLQEGGLTQEEQRKLDDWEAELDRKPGLSQSLSPSDQEMLKQRVWQNINKHTGQAPVVQMNTGRKRRWVRPMVAAAVLITIAATLFLWYNTKPGSETIAGVPNTIQQVNDVPPGGNKATLTLADGSTILLDDAANGAITQQGNVKVIKLNDGQLSYSSMNAPSGQQVYNTITTPKGGQYQLILSDGSKVWLNAASSIRFPTAFTGSGRQVTITGEAYFEVAHNQTKPFYVSANGLQVQVLGTHFNVNAYNNEDAIKTTLLEGSVRVGYNTETAILKPGQQAKVVTASDANIQVVKDADVELAVAWKNGFTSFKNADIKTMMRMVERWYDIEVVYEGQIPDRRFRGDISRSANLSEMLQLLKSNKINYRLEGKTLTIAR